VGEAAAQQPKEPEVYVYATYFNCDVAQQERADEIVEKLQRPIYDAASADGTIMGWGWLAHHTGGQWRRAQTHIAPSIAALLATQKKLGDQIEAKSKAQSQEFDRICGSHDDYIWRRVAGNIGARTRGNAAFSVYYVCDSQREQQADALVKRVFAPAYDKLVADGKLATWGWLEHIVGGQYRRLATISAPDVESLLAARTSLVQMLQDDPLGATLDDICGSHADYIWEIKLQKP
jgi:hypothetical protein